MGKLFKSVGELQRVNPKRNAMRSRAHMSPYKDGRDVLVGSQVGSPGQQDRTGVMLGSGSVGLENGVQFIL